MVIRSGLCLVRPWRRNDVDALVRHANDWEVARHLRDAFPYPYSPADANSWLEVAETSRVNWAIEVGGEAVGAIGLAQGADIARYSAELGYWLGRACWGRGIATAAVRGVTEHAFRDLGLLRVFALPFAENGASCRVLEKADYRREGVLRGSAVKAGRVMDQALFARVDPFRRPSLTPDSRGP